MALLAIKDLWNLNKDEDEVQQSITNDCLQPQISNIYIFHFHPVFLSTVFSVM
jgi:hypothetical protein